MTISATQNEKSSSGALATGINAAHYRDIEPAVAGAVHNGLVDVGRRKHGIRSTQFFDGELVTKTGAMPWSLSALIGTPLLSRIKVEINSLSVALAGLRLNLDRTSTRVFL